VPPEKVVFIGLDWSMI